MSKTHAAAEASSPRQAKRARGGEAANEAAAAASAVGYAEAANKHLEALAVDHLYHLGLDSSMDLRGMFGDTRVVLMGGTAERMREIAVLVGQRLGVAIPAGLQLAPIGKTERYSLFKAGPVVSVSHGMGGPSISILLHELFKLMKYAGAKDYCFIRVGTCGGVGLEPGTVVVSRRTLDEELLPRQRAVLFGVVHEFPTDFDAALSDAIARAAPSSVRVVQGDTMSANDFYEGQGRTDGALCAYGEAERKEFLRRMSDKGVVNIEMEGVVFGALCRRARVPAAMVAAVLVNRLKGDQVASTAAELHGFQHNAMEVVLAFLETLLRGK